MALPGIISCLHPVSDPEALTRQLMQGQQTRAEAFWLPASMHEQAAAVLTALDDKCSLFLEQPVADLPLRSHDGMVQEAHTLLLGNGNRIALAKVPGDGGLVPASGLAEMGQWLESGHLHFRCSAAVQPVARQGARALRPSGDPKADKRRYFMLAHGSHLVDLARYLGGPIRAVDARLVEKFGAYCWFVGVEFENGAVGHLDLTVAVRMDWHEGFEIYGQNGGVTAKTYNPWYYKSSDVEIFHEASAATTRVLGADGHFYRRQLEGFAEAALGGAMRGAGIADGQASTRAMVAIAESARTGRPVALADVAGAV